MKAVLYSVIGFQHSLYQILIKKAINKVDKGGYNSSDHNRLVLKKAYKKALFF
jgi:hypothetical protein